MKEFAFKNWLLAGKLKKFARRFPLQLFWEKFNEVTLQKFLITKNSQRQQLTENPGKNYCTTSLWKSNFDMSRLVCFSFRNNFSQTVLSSNFDVRDGFCARWCKSSPRHERDEMTNGSDRRQKNFNSEITGFLNLAKGTWTTVSTKWV